MGKLWERWLVSERIILTLLLAIVTLVLSYGNWLWRWDQAIYDAHFKLWSSPAPEDVIIVGIDADSLAQFGAWPWPRKLHAQLVENLTEAGAKVIIFDVIFAEASTQNPADDKLLASTFKQSGNVILPVLVEQSQAYGQLIETLPFPLLAAQTAGLGHVHVELDPDGIARSVYLKEGMGKAEWPTLSLAALMFLNPQFDQNLPGQQAPDNRQDSPFHWVRNFHVLIPFIGPPGWFNRVSYGQVLRKDYPPNTFSDKIVIIGATVSGLGDSLPTPVSGFNRPMPGVEVHANILTALRNNSFIKTVDKQWQTVYFLLVIMLPGLLYPLYTPRTTFFIAGSLIFSAMVISSALLFSAKLWLQPMPLIVALSLSYPIWSWRRQEAMINYLNNELERLSSEPVLLTSVSTPQINTTLELVAHLFPIDGYIVLDNAGKEYLSHGASPDTIPDNLPETNWLHNGCNAWRQLSYQDEAMKLGLHWPEQAEPEQQQLNAISELLVSSKRKIIASTQGTVGMIQTRIHQVQEAANKLRAMRRLLSDSLSEMADGILIADVYGQILLSNQHAAFFLTNNTKTSINNLSLTEALENLTMQTAVNWQDNWKKTITESVTTILYAQNPYGYDLLIQMSKLVIGATHPVGIIVNLTDITPLKESERRRSEFLGFLSHDLRSPLVSILALLELGKDPDYQAKEQNKLLLDIERYTKTLMEFSENFLQLARAEDLDNKSFAEVDLVNIAYNAIESVWPQATEKGITLKQQFNFDSIWIYGDGMLLERLLINLLTNAIKYSPADSAIKLAVSEAKGCWICSVLDQGDGIDEEFIPQLFDRFSREKSAIESQTSGLGLGLAFVKEVANKHNGWMEVQSKLGVGSCFTLYLPKTIEQSIN